MPTRQELKRRARVQLGGRIFSSEWLMALLVCFVAGAILSLGNTPSIISYSSQLSRIVSNAMNNSENFNVEISSGPLFGSFGTIIYIILAGPLNFGLSYLFLKQARDRQPMQFTDLFKGFTTDFGGNVLLGIMIAIFTTLWTLLFIIPGIVKSLAYSMAYYVKVDHPDWDWHACIDESKRITQGHKGELFVLELSFIGWYIVGALALGVGTLFVTPYLTAAQTHYYQELVYAAGPRNGYAPSYDNNPPYQPPYQPPYGDNTQPPYQPPYQQPYGDNTQPPYPPQYPDNNNPY